MRRILNRGLAAAALALAVSPTGRGGALTVLGGAIERAGVGEAPLGWRQMGEAWVRIPQRALPWGAVHFLGGAALGAAPQLVYDRLLTEICERAQVAVIAVPYSPEQDHDKLARQVQPAIAPGCVPAALQAGSTIPTTHHSRVEFRPAVEPGSERMTCLDSVFTRAGEPAEAGSTPSTLLRRGLAQRLGMARAISSAHHPRR
jgi:hypothetical protein